MSLRYAILGFLSWKAHTGYELKKLFADSLSFYWSGNSNQIYGCLLQLHKEGSVSSEIQQQDKYPARKVYAITAQGREELRAWLLGKPELPEIKDFFHIQLAWAEPLSYAELDRLFIAYEEGLEAQILMCREKARRERMEGDASKGRRPGRNPRESLIWKRIAEGRVSAFEAELSWARGLRWELLALEKGEAVESRPAVEPRPAEGAER